MRAVGGDQDQRDYRNDQGEPQDRPAFAGESKIVQNNLKPGDREQAERGKLQVGEKNLGIQVRNSDFNCEEGDPPDLQTEKNKE